MVKKKPLQKRSGFFKLLNSQVIILRIVLQLQ